MKRKARQNNKQQLRNKQNCPTETTKNKTMKQTGKGRKEKKQQRNKEKQLKKLAHKKNNNKPTTQANKT